MFQQDVSVDFNISSSSQSFLFPDSESVLTLLEIEQYLEKEIGDSKYTFIVIGLTQSTYALQR